MQELMMQELLLCGASFALHYYCVASGNGINNTHKASVKSKKTLCPSCLCAFVAKSKTKLDFLHNLAVRGVLRPALLFCRLPATE